MGQLNEEDPNPFEPFQIIPSKPKDPNAELEPPTQDPNGPPDTRFDTTRVLFWPHGESEQKIGRGGTVLETFDVSALFVRRLTDEYDRDTLGEVVRTLKQKIRKGGKMAGYTYKTAVTAKFDLDLLHENGLFYCATVLSYMGAGG